MRGTKYAELPSSLHTVMSNDDLLIEILLCLPAISILVCKSVSKRWLSLITDTSFTLRCSQIPKLDFPSGLFIKKPNSSVFEYNLVPLDVKIPRNMSFLDETFTFGSEEGNVEILQSCNGLLLCCSGIEPYKLYVYNPTINMFKMIPRPPGGLHLDRFHMTISLKMAFDPTKSLYYKLIYYKFIFLMNDTGYVEIETYSSETGYWNVFGDRLPCENFINFGTAIYLYDAFHWLSCLDNPTHFRLNIVDHPVVTTIQTPGNMLYDSRLFVSLGCLLFLCRLGNPSDDLYVYEMRNGDSRWSMKCLINSDDIINPGPWRKPIATGRCYKIWSIVFGKSKEDSYLVTVCYGEVLQYRFELEKENVRTLSHYGSDHTPHYGYQFIASFARV